MTRHVELVVPFQNSAGVSLGDLVVPVHVHGDDFTDTPEIRMRLGVEAYGARLNVRADIPADWLDAGQLHTEPVVLRSSRRELVATTVRGAPTAVTKESFPGDGPRLVSVEWADEA